MSILAVLVMAAYYTLGVALPLGVIVGIILHDRNKKTP